MSTAGQEEKTIGEVKQVRAFCVFTAAIAFALAIHVIGETERAAQSKQVKQLKQSREPICAVGHASAILVGAGLRSSRVKNKEQSRTRTGHCRQAVLP